MLICVPVKSANSRKIFTHALRSDVQVFTCTIATSSPQGVVTTSISGYAFFSGSSRTTIANTDVPAETLPVRFVMLFVATIPVPASPSGGHIGIPPFKSPEGSKSFAPSSVREPAFSPATSTLGRISSAVIPTALTEEIALNFSSIPLL